MIVYMDTSVILRKLLGEPDSLSPWGGWNRVFTSTLTRVEFFRVIDRLRLDGGIDDSERLALQERFSVFWKSSYRVSLTESILKRSEQPFPTCIGTLDALHLASALAVRDGGEDEMTMLTHDRQLGRAAVAMEFSVLGVVASGVWHNP